jgi:hypothetical protein
VEVWREISAHPDFRNFFNFGNLGFKFRSDKQQKYTAEDCPARQNEQSFGRASTFPRFIFNGKVSQRHLFI